MRGTPRVPDMFAPAPPTTTVIPETGDPFAPRSDDLEEVETKVKAKRASKAMKRSPTESTLAHMRKQGCTCQVVEHWNPHVRIRQDLFQVIDVLCLHPDGTTIGVQSCRRADIATRAAKIAESDHIAAIRRCGWRVLVHGWDQPEGPGGEYRVKEVDVS